MPADEFILRHTRLQRPDHTPEIQLYLGDDPEAVWRATRAEALPFWAFAWAGGLAVARYVLDHPETVAGKRVLDFAAGSGLCAIAAMKAGGTRALAADVDPFAEAAVVLNAAANGVTVDFTAQDLLQAEPPDVDVILAGDVCYEQAMAARVISWLARAHALGVRVLLGDPGRTHLPGEGLVPLASHKVPTTLELEDAPVKQAGVYTFLAGHRVSG